MSNAQPLSRIQRRPLVASIYDSPSITLAQSSFDDLPVALKDLLCPGWEQ
jgi:hypothetical protein